MILHSSNHKTQLDFMSNNRKLNLSKLLPLGTVAAIFILVGCSIPRYEWVHPVKEAPVWYQDKLNCVEYATQLAIDMYPHPQVTSTVVVNTVVDSEQTSNGKSKKSQVDPLQYKRKQYHDSLVKDCLYAEGWQRIRIPEVPVQ